METAEPLPWVEPVSRQLSEVLALRSDWDSYGAPPIDPEVLAPMARALSMVMGASTPAPHLAPTPRAGVLLEWHRNNINLEIDVEPSGMTWVVLDAPDLDLEGRLGRLQAVVRATLLRLSE